MCLTCLFLPLFEVMVFKNNSFFMLFMEQHYSKKAKASVKYQKYLASLQTLHKLTAQGGSGTSSVLIK